MTTKKVSPKNIEKAAEEFRRERAEARPTMNKEIAAIKETLRKSSQNAQMQVREVWVQYRAEAITYRATMDKINDIWDAHAARKLQAWDDIAAAKTKCRAILKKTFEYAGYTPS